MKTTTRTFETGIWHKAGHDVPVIRLAIPTGMWIGTNQGQRLVVGNGDALLHLALAVSLCESAGAIVWLTGGACPPPSLVPNVLIGNGAVVVSDRKNNLSLKGWHDIRGKLRFSPRRWHVPTRQALATQADAEPLLKYEGYQGTCKDNGTTLLLNLDREGIRRMMSVLWWLREDRRELIDYGIWYLAQEDDIWDIRLYYSCFKTRYVYAWESESMAGERRMNAGKLVW